MKNKMEGTSLKVLCAVVFISKFIQFINFIDHSFVPGGPPTFPCPATFTSRLTTCLEFPHPQGSGPATLSSRWDPPQPHGLLDTMLYKFYKVTMEWKLKFSFKFTKAAKMAKNMNAILMKFILISCLSKKTY